MPACLVRRRAVASSAVALVLMIGSAAAEPDRHEKTILQCNEELKADKAALAAAGESVSKFIHDCWWHSKAGQPTPIAGARAPKPDDEAAKLKKAEAEIAKAKAEAAAAKADAARATREAAEAEIAKAQAEAAAAKEDAARATREAAEARKAVDSSTPKTSVATQAPRDDAKPVAKSDAKPVAKPVTTALAPSSDRDKAPTASVPHVRVPAEPPRKVAAVHRRPVSHAIFVAPPPRLLVRPPRDVPPPRRVAGRRIERDARPVAVPPRPPGEEAAAPVMDMVPVHIAGTSRPIAWPVFPAFVPSFRYAVNHPVVPGFTSTP